MQITAHAHKAWCRQPHGSCLQRTIQYYIYSKVNSPAMAIILCADMAIMWMWSNLYYFYDNAVFSIDNIYIHIYNRISLYALVKHDFVFRIISIFIISILIRWGFLFRTTSSRFATAYAAVVHRAGQRPTPENVFYMRECIFIWIKLCCSQIYWSNHSEIFSHRAENYGS